MKKIRNSKLEIRKVLMADSTVKLLFFSLLQDIAKTEEMDFSLVGDSITVGALLAALFERFEGLSDWDEKLLIAVNCEYADRDFSIKAGDEVAIMPPVQGG